MFWNVPFLLRTVRFDCNEEATRIIVIPNTEAKAKLLCDISQGKESCYFKNCVDVQVKNVHGILSKYVTPPQEKGVI